MKILGIESASLTASAAIWEDDMLTAEYTVNHKKTHSQTLLPMIDEIVRRTETDLKTLDAIAVSGGPGSFTGLRIGSATAKGLGQALDKPLIHVPTLDAMAYEHFGTDRLICPMLDARREQVYCGLYEFHEEFRVIRDLGTDPGGERPWTPGGLSGGRSAGEPGEDRGGMHGSPCIRTLLCLQAESRSRGGPGGSLFPAGNDGDGRRA